LLAAWHGVTAIAHAKTGTAASITFVSFILSLLFKIFLALPVSRLQT
jgi:hypothetical protein